MKLTVRWYVYSHLTFPCETIMCLFTAWRVTPANVTCSNPPPRRARVRIGTHVDKEYTASSVLSVISRDILLWHKNKQVITGIQI